MNKRRFSATCPSVHTLALRTACFFAAFVFFALCVSVSSDVKAAPVVIDFEGLQPPITILSQFASQGATFNGPMARDYSQMPGFAHSGTRAIELCFAAEFCTTPLNINFTTGQAHAKLWVGYSSQLSNASRVVFQALDVNGVLVDQTSVVLGPSAGPIPVQTPLEVNSPSKKIRQLVLMFAANPGELAFNNGLVVDDVEFSTAGPPPACGTLETPDVTLIQPPRLLQNLQTTVQINEFVLEGVVFTSVPLDEATLTVAGPGGTRSFDLLGSGIVSRTSGHFGPTRVDGALSPGLNNVSVLVRNCAGTHVDRANVLFAPIAPGTSFKFLGMEVTQATQDLRNSVPLVANKPTVVRLYLNVNGPTNSINEVSAAITATHPGGSTLVPLLHSTNAITVDSSPNVNAKRRSLNASLNFVLPPDWFAAGTLHFEVSKLYIQGAESSLLCDGCRNLDEINAPRFVQFRPTKPLNLVLAPYEYSRSQSPTPDILFTPMGALQWLNNVYPVSGSFPSDGAGVRLLRILPTRPTMRDLHTDDGIGDFLEDLQDVMNDLQDQSGNDWPSDARLFGMVPSGSGGAGCMPGNVAYGDTWAVENGLVPETNYESYGSIWAQEIGHNFDRRHAGNSHNEQPPPDLNFPFPHGGIGEPGLAISTEWWNGSPFLIVPGLPAPGRPHAHDFMSYGSVNSAGGEHTRSWVSPYTYDALFQSFEDLTQARAVAAPKRTEKLVVVGRINIDGTARLRPFHRVTTEFTSGPGTTGEFSVDLVAAGGQTLLSHRFNPQHLGRAPLLSFSEYVPWKTGTQLIVIKQREVVLAKGIVSAHKPWVRVTSPKKGEIWGAKSTITWEAGDEDNDPLTYTVLYNSGLDQIWLPIANGVTKLSTTVDTTLLPGSTRARVRVRVTDGVNTTESESEGTFTVPEKRPLIAILGSTNGRVLAPGVSAQFVGAAYDPEDGMLPSTSLTWTSDRDGLMGQGRCLAMRPLSRGPHLITLTATDSQGRSVSARVNVIVGLERLPSR
jgi:hypothetical protein